MAEENAAGQRMPVARRPQKARAAEGLTVNERVARLRQQSLGATPYISGERARLITEFYQAADFLAATSAPAAYVSAPVLRAMAFQHLLENKAIPIGEGELIVGERGPAPKATPKNA